MVIECNYCEAKVDAKVIANNVSTTPEDPFPFRATLVRCPSCGRALLAGEEKVQVGEDSFDWTPPVRLWPQPKHHLDWSIPEIVRISIEEAQLCFNAKAYSACAVMCGRSLEGMLIHFETKKKSLAAGFSELLDKKIIDDRLFQWGEELRRLRNLSAHATGESISREDAQDILDFAKAIADYVFVLSARFERFMRRKEETKAVG